MVSSDGQSHRTLFSIVAKEQLRSLIVGFALSLLGSILLFLGQLGSFAGMSPTP